MERWRMGTLRPYQNAAINKLREAYRQGYKSPCLVAPCGAGKSVTTAEIAKLVTEKKQRVLFLIHRQELQEQIHDTFTAWGVNMAYCNIAMVQTVVKKLDRIPKPHLIITDEGHHCLANTYKKIYEYYQDVNKLMVTATPTRLNGGGLGEVCDILVPTVPVKWLIENNYLAPYDYYAPTLISTDGLHSRAGDYVKSEVQERIEQSCIYGDVIEHYNALSKDKQAIIYCATLENSKRVVEEFNAQGIASIHLDGTTPTEERKQAIQDFRNGKIKILSNVDLISEGFDVPDCNTVILLRPTKSLNLFIQQAMRCMRYKKGKRAVIIDHVNNVSRFGLPDEEREWTLETKRGVNNASTATIKVKQCEECFYTHEPSPVCPNCGYVYPIKKRALTIQEKKDIKLQKVTESIKHYTTENECKSMAELVAYAKKLGYKPGWAYFQAKKRGLVK